MRRPTLSIRSTVLIAIAAAVLLPALLLWNVEQTLTREAQMPLIEQNRKAVLVMAAAGVVEPMWTIDERAMDAAVRKTLEEPSVLSLRLTEQRPGTKPVVMSKPGAEPGRGVPLKTRITREGEALGELEMWFDAEQIDRLLAERRVATMQLRAAGGAGHAGLLAVLNGRLLAPIRRLKQQASEIASRADVAPVDWSRRDELGQLGQHLNEVHSQIDELFDQLEAQKAELEKIALHDPLTGLPNRRLFGELTQAAVAAAQRDHGKLALLFIDIDRFKSVNDSLGHAAGDRLLRTIAERLRGAVRASDVVCRHSGDEFTVLLRNAEQWDEVAATADRLLKEVEAPLSLNGATSRCLPASASRSTLPMRPTTKNWCATPTPRCTRRRIWAALATASSAPSSTSSFWRPCNSSRNWCGRWSTTSSSSTTSPRSRPRPVRSWVARR
jgi:diguanylate cyclase (GGDEF)-like protein